MNDISALIEQIDRENLWDKELILKRNEFLNVQGSIDTNFYLIAKGSLRIFMLDDLEEHTIRLGYKNNLIAALDSFLHGKASDLYIQALKKTNLKVVKKATLMQLMNSSPALIQLWNKILESFILQQMEREKDILTTSPVERYRRVLKRSPQLFQEIPNKYIASYLRMSPETLSRIMSNEKRK